MSKFENIEKRKLFGNYADPFAARRISGPLAPQKDITSNIPDLKRSFDGGNYYAWFGHSSIFLAINKVKILIDPIFSKYASPLNFVGPKRFKGRTVKSNEIPDIDIVLISHCHYDHLDKKTINKIKDRAKYFVVPLGVGKHLENFEVPKSKIIELYWWEERELFGLNVVLLPSQHGSARTGFDSDKSLWGSFLVKSDSFNAFYTGDGGYSKTFKQIFEAYGPMDITFCECGQYNTKWHGFHMFPEEGVRACLDLKTKIAVPVHWGGYVLSDHYYLEPVIRFEQRAIELGLNYAIPEHNKLVKIEKV